jgi:RNA polymerase sigma-70 factor, ECF subfamily
MMRRGLSKRNRGPTVVPGPAPDRALESAGTPASDLELEKRWLQLVAVDAEQFRVFYDKYHDPLFRFIAHHVGDAETAQDLTQDVFIHALEHLDRFSWQGYSFGAWLFHIARRRVLPRHWRSRVRHPGQAVARDEAVPDVGADQAGDLERDQLRRRVREMMTRFPDERYDVFVLRVFMEWSEQDTALAMGMKPKTVRSHLARGRAQLAEWLHDEAALTVDERRALNLAQAAGRGLEFVPSLRAPRRRPPHADGPMDGASDVKASDVDASDAEGGDDDE